MRKFKLIALSVITVAALIVSGLLVGNFLLGDGAVTGEEDTEKALVTGEPLFDADKVSLVKEEVTISTEILEDGLRDMGKLVTQEYYFTQAETYEKKSTVGPLTSTAKMIYSYDGTVSAGIDCNRIVVKKDDEEKTITIRLPDAEIFDVDIDYDTFQEYESKQGLWSKIKLSDVNKSLQEFEEAAETNAIEKGLLTAADKNAELIIDGFVRALMNDSSYSVKFVHE